MNISLWKEVQNRGSVVNSRKSAVGKRAKERCEPNKPRKKKKNNNVRRRQKPSGNRTAKKLTAKLMGSAGQGSSCPGAFGSLCEHFIASSRLGVTLAVQNL
jgi:hypothetical protein